MFLTLFFVLGLSFSLQAFVSLPKPADTDLSFCKTTEITDRIIGDALAGNKLLTVIPATATDTPREQTQDKEPLKQEAEQLMEETDAVPTIDQIYWLALHSIKINDLATVEKLFKDYPQLASFTLRATISPFDCVRSLAMTKLLVEKVGFSPNRCNEVGQMPADLVRRASDSLFTSPQQKAAIIAYLELKSSLSAKAYYQVRYNHGIHATFFLCALTLSFLGY